jgi:hypothetical protein
MDILPICDIVDDILFCYLLIEIIYLLIIGSVTKSKVMVNDKS